MDENYDAFDDYAMKFDLNEEMIAYKYNHTYRVVHQAEEICRSINLDTEERDLASLIALLHDIARFKQWTEFKTYIDKRSFDHADEGVKILFDEGLINKFKVKKDDLEIVKKAIYYHNKYELPSNELSIRENLHSKIIRDADKLDILYAFSTNKLLKVETDDEEISDEVHDEFFKNIQVLKSSVKNKNDHLLMLIAMIFDLNYDYSKKRILREKYLDKILSYTKNKEIFKPYIEEAKKYLRKKD